jgi:hypothetical protein
MFKKSLSLILVLIALAVTTFAQEEKDFATADSLLKKNEFEKSIQQINKLISYNSIGPITII